MTRFTIRLDSPGVALALKRRRREKSTHSFDLLIPRWHLHSSDWASSKIYRVWEWYIFKDLPLLRCDWVWPASRVRRFRGQITVSRARRVTLRASAHWKWQIACLPNSMKISTFPTHIQPPHAHTHSPFVSDSNKTVRIWQVQMCLIENYYCCRLAAFTLWKRNRFDIQI